MKIIYLWLERTGSISSIYFTTLSFKSTSARSKYDLALKEKEKEKEM